MSPRSNACYTARWHSVKRSASFVAVFVVACFSPAMGRTQDEGSRQILLDEFSKARPAKSSEKSTSPAALPIYRANTRSQKQKPLAGAARRRPESTVKAATNQETYQPQPNPAANKIGQGNQLNSSGLQTISLGSNRNLGVTIWRLPPNAAFADFDQPVCRSNARSIDSSREIGQPIINNAPLRVSSDTLFRTGDRVRLSIESPRPGYLYIINREVYADQSYGTAKLIFPTQRIRGGNNYLAPGSPVEFPDLCDNANYLEFLIPRGEKKPVAEALIMIVTDKPLAEVGVPSEAFRIPEAWMTAWEARWSGRTDVYELEKGEGQPYTLAELNAGFEVRVQGQHGTRELAQGSPQPQTLYSVNSGGDGLMAQVILWYE